jgi:LmbE family N-acetylglucosaminyl deacetylase
MKVLAVGAHPDDIELGCFGSLARHASSGDQVTIFILTAGESGGDPVVRKQESKESGAIIGAQVHFADLPDTLVRDDYSSISLIEQAILKIKPDIIYTPSHKDRHQDHRNTSRATISAARQVHEVYMYETPSTVQDFSPQLFVDVTNFFSKKLEAIKKHRSQEQRYYMIHEAVKGLATFRAYQAGIVANGYAEAFEIAVIVKT